MNCASCKKLISHTKLLGCSTCKNVYHYDCLNITAAFYAGDPAGIKSTWHCPTCGKLTKLSMDTPTLPHDIVKTTGVQEQHEAKSSKKDQRLNTETITYEQISQLLDRKLGEKFEIIQNYISSEIRNTVQTEVPKVLHEFIEQSKIMHQEQININSNIKIINEKIEKLEIEQTKLENEITTKNTEDENN